ncbi:HlyD family secretion protein [Neorhizobium galegae]|uniref:HlyD family secretion protein n=1 Tax=Neorhizobium galegae TaxID=399 RepID=UPI0006222AE7|nr:HlyD family efflux transporter periplasmic adaptor subunit [Neorhizobium galegae]KAB1124154.1 HlyD family efflux transporter periplasmic adaptor subunit [Neorhizobium galegae]MCQ1809746.1 HlyD family efflux transporter periplasmic adaptor subunit [Neorhizobium galegae]CDZ56565.1 Secretion protein HlyD family protein [Neorhizobium galegae bv. orientalis]
MRRILVIVLLAGATLAALPFLLADRAPRPYQGWVEADTLFIGTETTGRLTKLDVAEGQATEAGAPLFKLDSLSEEAAVAAASAALAQSQAALDLSEAAQKRPEEIDVLRASEREATARLDLAEQDLDRTRVLVERGTSTRANLDTATATEAANRAALDNVRSQIILAALPARDETLRQARESVAAAKAELASAQAVLARRSVSAPATGSVETLYYRTGEVVPAGRPIVALLPPENVRIRFFVPETEIARLSLGQPIRVTCDACRPTDAKVSFIAKTAEYTPPEIYSLEERAKLVYRVEAIPADPKALRPGQPVDVAPGPRP